MDKECLINQDVRLNKTKRGESTIFSIKWKWGFYSLKRLDLNCRVLLTHFTPLKGFERKL